MVTKTNELVGAECGACHGEAFQLVEREVLVRARVCPRCVRRIDGEREEETIQDALVAMEKSERKQALREKSFGWASSLHGRQVVVYYTVSNGCGVVVRDNCQIKGTVYRAGNQCGGWGNVRVVIDQSELHRITFIDDYYWQDRKQVWYKRPVVDGFKWGLYLPRSEQDQPVCFYVSWGQRQEMQIEVVH